MRWPNSRDVLAVLLIAAASGALFLSPLFDRGRGLSLDVLTALRWQVFGNPSTPSPVAVVVIDEETFNTKPFQGSPTLTWTPAIGRVLTSILEGGAKVIGLDIVYPSSIEQSEIEFGSEALGARLRGFDREFLRSLAAGARDGRVILGEVQHRDRPVRPAPGQRIAVGQQRNIRALNAYNDPDDVIRRLPLMLAVDGAPVPSMALELASRATGEPAQRDADGTVRLGNYRIPSAVPNTVTLNFSGGANDIPTYSFADLHACLQKQDNEYFRRNFEGKAILFGTLLDVEDRKTTTKRFATGIEAARAPRCVLPAREAPGQFRRSTISGVYIHATGVKNLIQHDAVAEIGSIGRAAITVGFAATAGTLALMLVPLLAVLGYLLLSLAGVIGATLAFTQGLALPLAEPIMAGGLALAATIGYRFVLSDKEKRFIRKTFSYYLAPQVVDRLIDSNKPPELGGEMRHVTVFFSDIAGFSSFSETMSPTELVTLMNEYLSAMSNIIESNGGFVDKYIGDAIVAVFGAPMDDPDHALNATRSALQCARRLDELNRTSFRERKLGQRIGLNSGDALVGNIGSQRRFNYTVMSDAVNLASRLEGANKFFGTSIMASETTVALTGDVFAWRELDEIRVKGRSRPVKIYELVDEAGLLTAQQQADIAAYVEGLARWRSRNFAGAAESFERAAATDRPSALFLSRARPFVRNPPGPEWDAVCTLEEK
jgi:class 3 adenylate cyclase